MPTFVLFTRVSEQSLHQPKSFETLERHAMERVRAECPGIEWIGNYALLGPWDYLDIFEAPDIEAATRVSVLLRTHAHVHAEVWPAMEWSRFKEIVRNLPGEAARRPWEEAV